MGIRPKFVPEDLTKEQLCQMATDLAYHNFEIQTELAAWERIKKDYDSHCVIKTKLLMAATAEIVRLTNIIHNRAEDKEILREYDRLKETKKIDHSCLPCVAMDGDCCGVLYWADNGDIKCNECGMVFKVEAERTGSK